MGGLHPAGEWIAACLKNNKSVVTANKELIAAQGAQLLALARQHQVNLLFEASVGGGIPIIRPLHQCLGANELDDIQGILNGTTNFILTKMSREGMCFSQALQMAQQLGYAEADPTADVQGLDACRKICILASLAFGRQLYPQLVHCQGITELTPEDVEYARNWGGVIKLIARAHRDPDTQQLSALVAPMFVPHDSQLSTVDDVFNGILVDGDATGQVLFYGKGAGQAAHRLGGHLRCHRLHQSLRHHRHPVLAGRQCRGVQPPAARLAADSRSFLPAPASVRPAAAGIYFPAIG